MPCSILKNKALGILNYTSNFAAHQPQTIFKQLLAQHLWYWQKSHASSRLALRAGVLRRAVSHPAPPILRSAASSVSVGRSTGSTAAGFINQALRQQKMKTRFALVLIGVKRIKRRGLIG